jgi:transposase
MVAKQSSAVDKALRLIGRGMTAYAAAKKTGIALSTIYRALKRVREQSK